MNGGRRYVPILGVFALLVAAMIAAVYSDPVIRTVPPGPVSLPTMSQGPGNSPNQPLVVPVNESGLPNWIILLALALGALFVVGLVVLVIWGLLQLRVRVARRKLAPGADATRASLAAQEQLRAAVDEGLADLDAGEGDPRRAVIACWVRLEEAAAAAGTPREIGDTSTDLVGRLLAAHSVRADVLDRLAEVYRRARFTTHVIDVAMRDEARSALLLIRDDLAGRPAVVSVAAARHAAPDEADPPSDPAGPTTGPTARPTAGPTAGPDAGGGR